MVVYDYGALHGLTFLLVVLGVAFGALVTAGYHRQAVALVIVMGGLSAELRNVEIGAQIKAANESLRHAGFTNTVHRVSQTAPFHVVFLVMLLVAALVLWWPQLRSVCSWRPKSLKWDNQ